MAIGAADSKIQALALSLTKSSMLRLHRFGVTRLPFQPRGRKKELPEYFGRLSMAGIETPFAVTESEGP